MTEIVDYHLPHSVNPQTVIAIVALVFAAAFIFWRNNVRKAQRQQPAHPAKAYPHGEFRRYTEMTVMVGVCIAAVAIFVDVGPTVYHQLGHDIWRLSEPSLLFTFGLFCASIAVTFVSVREFFRLLRA